jgi:hypothetical protein
MGETRVDLLHLLEDLRDAYPGAIEETILTEIVANSLDSGATRIFLQTDPAQATLTVVDNGSGMQRRDLVRYHDLAASTKTRGEGIGFAGVGIKLGLLVCEEVVTETRRGKTHVATRWALASRHRAPWKWIPPPGLVVERGTGVRLKLQNALSPLLDDGYVEATVRHHFQSLLDPTFADILAAHYPKGVVFEVNDRRLAPESWRGTETAPIAVRLARKRKPTAVGYLVREPRPLPEDRRGLAICTFGKVIRRGWEWLGLTPSAPDRIGGVIEAPALAACLTLNKGDFVRVGSRGAIYLAYRKALQEAVAAQLAVWGDGREPTEEIRRRKVRPVERDLEQVLVDLAEDFPLLASLVERRAGGQKRLPIGRGGEAQDGPGPLAATVAPPAEHAIGDGHTEQPESRDLKEPAEGPTQPPAQAEPETEPPATGTVLPGARGKPRPARYGLSIRFESAPDDAELGRLVESTVVVNDAHPAYRRAEASRSEGYHLALTVALALAPLAVEPADEHDFVTAFLARWGEALKRPPGRRR